MSFVDEAMREHWGTRCLDFDANCPVCKAWAELDERDLRAVGIGLEVIAMRKAIDQEKVDAVSHHEIEVTPAMLEAGMAELFEHNFSEEPRYILETVYRAMAYAGPPLRAHMGGEDG